MPADSGNESSDEHHADRAWAVAAFYGAIKYMAPDLLLAALRVGAAVAAWGLAAIGVAMLGLWWILAAALCLLGHAGYLGFRVYHVRRELRRLPPAEQDDVVAANRDAIKARLTCTSSKIQASLWSITRTVPLTAAAYLPLARWWTPVPAVLAVTLLAIWRTASPWLPLPQRSAQVSSLFEERRGPDGLPTPEI